MDIRPTELITTHAEKVTHRLDILHIKTGLSVRGTGLNRYALECELLQLLGDKIEAAKAEEAGGVECLK